MVYPGMGNFNDPAPGFRGAVILFSSFSVPLLLMWE
jgi:hypothetical protein